MRRLAYQHLQGAILTSTNPYGMRVRMAMVHAEPSTHMAGLIRVLGVAPPPTEPFGRPGQCPPQVTF